MNYRTAEDQHIEQWLRVLHILWCIFLGSTLLYFPAAYVLSRAVASDGGILGGLRPVAYAGGVGLLLAARLLPMPEPMRAGQDRSVFVGKTQTIFLVRWVLTETVSILGLLLAAFGAALLEVVPFLAAGAIGIGLLAPSRAALRARLGVGG